jgi:hypothetical protein
LIASVVLRTKMHSFGEAALMKAAARCRGQMPRLLVFARRDLGEMVDAAVDVRVLLPVEPVERLDHHRRLLGTRRAIEEDERLAALRRGLRQDRKIGPDRRRIERRRRR